MANELAIRTNFVGGLVENNPLNASDTTLTSAALAAMAVVDATNHCTVILDPDGIAGPPEIVWVTVHTAGATTATLLRAVESTSARNHNIDTPWIHAPTAADYTNNIINDRAWIRGSTRNVLDDEFNDSSLDSAWVRIDTNAVVVTYTEGADLLSISNAGGDAASYAAHSLVKPMGAFAIGQSIEICCRIFRRYASNYYMFGPIMTNGATTSAAAIWMRPYGYTGQAVSSMLGAVGRYNAISGTETASVGSEQAWEWIGAPLYQRLKWTAANTFDAYWSADGVSWLRLPAASITSHTMTPTHIGFCLGTWSGANPCYASVEYFRVV